MQFQQAVHIDGVWPGGMGVGRENSFVDKGIMIGLSWSSTGIIVFCFYGLPPIYCWFCLIKPYEILFDCFSETSLLQLEVPQFITTAITTSILSAQDDFTEENHLVFVIDKDKLPSGMKRHTEFKPRFSQINQKSWFWVYKSMTHRQLPNQNHFCLLDY